MTRTVAFLCGIHVFACKMCRIIGGLFRCFYMYILESKIRFAFFHISNL